MTLAERAAYIQGLAEGMDLDADKKEVRIINEMLDLLSEVAGTVQDVSEGLIDLYEVVDEIDEDLGAIEEEMYGDFDEDFDGDDVYEITCPNCEEAVELTEDMLMEGDIVCPSCGEKIEIEIDDCDCGGDHDHHHHD